MSDPRGILCHMNDFMETRGARGKGYDEDDAMVMRVLYWCGEYLTPQGLSAEILTNDVYLTLRAEKELAKRLADSPVANDSVCDRFVTIAGRRR